MKRVNRFNRLIQVAVESRFYVSNSQYVTNSLPLHQAWTGIGGSLSPVPIEYQRGPQMRSRLISA